MTRVEEIEARKAEILAAVDQEGADVSALETEVRALNAELKSIKEEAEKRQAIRDEVSAGAGTVIKTYNMEERKMEEKRSNEELYRIAFLKNLAVRDGQHLFGEMTEEERTAFIATTTNTGNVVPTVMMNRIIELVESMAPMYDDAFKSNMTQGFGVPRHTGITQGDATGVEEGAANEDEQDTFDLLNLEGVELKKHIQMSRKLKFKSIDAFQAWVEQNLAQRIAVAKEATIRARLDGTAPAGGSVIAGSGIASGNFMTNLAYTDASITSMFAKLKGQGARVLYANTNTIWSHLVGIVDAAGNKLFTPNSMVDPVAQGRIYGAVLKVDDNLADNVVYLGIKGKVLANDYDDLFVFHATEPKTANEIVTGYSLFDAGLENPKGFVKATFAPSV